MQGARRLPAGRTYISSATLDSTGRVPVNPIVGGGGFGIRAPGYCRAPAHRRMAGRDLRKTDGQWHWSDRPRGLAWDRDRYISTTAASARLPSPAPRRLCARCAAAPIGAVVAWGYVYGWRFGQIRAQLPDFG